MEKMNNKQLTKLHQAYEKDLDRFVDIVFMEACDHYGYSWGELAKLSGLSYSTVSNLGNRKTRLPQLRTVWKLARSVGMVLQLTKHIEKHKRAVSNYIPAFLANPEDE